MAENVVEEKIVSILDALQKGAVELGGKAVKYAPDVADTALLIVRVDAIETILYALVTVFLSWKIAFFMIKKGKQLGDGDLEIGCYVVSGIMAILALIGLRWLIDVWSWVAIFEPKLALAKMIVDSVMH